MRYLKTFENYSQPVNEEFLGLDKLFTKVKDAFSSWKNAEQKKAAEFLAKAIEENKDKPEMKEALAKLKEAGAKLPEEDKKKIMDMAKAGEIKEVPETEEGEALKDQLKEGEVSESLLLEKEGSLVGKIIYWFGLSVTSTSFVTLIITVIKIAIAESGFPTWLFGLSLGTIGGILMISTFVGGMITAVGDVMKSED